MQWKSADQAAFSGGLGFAGQPARNESMTLVDRDGNTVATFTRGADNSYSLSVPGTVGGTDVQKGGVSTPTNNSALRVAHCIYNFSVDGGAQATIAPVNSDTIPINAILVGATINSTTAAGSGGSATIAVGTSAGSSTTSIKGATAFTSYSLNAIQNGVPVFATPVKMTAAGTITFTIATANLNAGVIEVWVYYVVASA